MSQLPGRRISGKQFLMTSRPVSVPVLAMMASSLGRFLRTCARKIDSWMMRSAGLASVASVARALNAAQTTRRCFGGTLTSVPRMEVLAAVVMKRPTV